MLPILEESRTRTSHPLEPLSPAEIELAVKTLRAKSPSASLRFVAVALKEPDKKLVLDRSRHAAAPREASLILLDNATGFGYEAVVDLGAGKVMSLEQMPAGVQPPIMLDEFIECEEAVKRSPQFLEAIRKRGVHDVALVMVDPWSAGMYGTERPEEMGKRLSRALCWVRSEAGENGYARPIDNIVAVVDLNKMEVLRVEDYGVVPLPPEGSNWGRQYASEVRQDLKPIEVIQPEGTSFQVEGHEISWQKWRFRIGFTPREGLVLHTVTYRDAGRERPILYRASVCDMVVPYGDPREQYYRKNAFDIGEYGVGMLANSLELGCDCLGQIRYFDANMTDSRGNLFTIKNAVCLHEEDYGTLWKHTDWRTNQTEVRRSRRLVVSFVTTVGNYEYGFYWHFYQDGSIQLELKLTGIMNSCALMPGEKPKYGTIVGPQVQAPYHQHIFNARIDFSVDGEANSVYEVNTASEPRDDRNNPHGNAFRTDATLLRTEREARRDTNSATARFWRVVNPHSINRLGQPAGYRLVPGENSLALAADDAAVLRRAGFMRHALWVTPYRAEERFAAGEYPNQNEKADGLPKWTEQDRAVAETDVVIWYTMGHTHVPRPEDWPVMPVHHMGFWLKPDGFFERNPAMDVAPNESKHSALACCHSGNGGK